MKRLLLIIVAICGCLALFAVEYKPYQPAQQAQIKGYNANTLNATAPTYQFNGTSSMMQGSYTVPVAVMDVEVMDMLEDPSSSSKSGPRRIGTRPEDYDPDIRPDDPTPADDMPVGNTPWLFMALMALGYIALRAFRTRNSGVQD